MFAGSEQNRPSPGSVNQFNEQGRFTMRARSGSEVIDQDRRQLLSTAAMGIAAEINTATTILTLLMVALLQNSQTRTDQAT